MRIFRVLYSASLLLALSVLGYVAYVFLAPVAPHNVELRANSMCVIGNVAVQINEKFALTGMTPKPLDCSCVSAKLRQRGNDAARLVETARQLFVNSMRNVLRGQQNSFGAFDRAELRLVQEFFGLIGEECKTGSG